MSVGTDSGRWDAEVIDHPELTAFPGWVEAHATRGMDRPNENIEVAPFLDVRDSIDPINFYFEDCLRQGVLAINVQQGNLCAVGGQGRVVKPFGLTIEDMTLRPSSGLKIAAARPGRSRALQAQSLRRAFRDLRLHLEKLVQDKKDGKDTARRQALYQGRDLEKEENKKGRAMEGNARWKLKDLEIATSTASATGPTSGAPPSCGSPGCCTTRAIGQRITRHRPGAGATSEPPPVRCSARW